MAKKKLKKQPPAMTPEAKNIKAPHIVQDDKPFDFGGLPDRDLKKNLGCG